MQKLNVIESQLIRENLIKEYGYLLPFLQTCSFYIIEITPDLIEFGQADYFDTLTPDKVKSYKNFNGIMGLVRKSGNKYRVIDGYHRLKANLSNPISKVILAI